MEKGMNMNLKGTYILTEEEAGGVKVSHSNNRVMKMTMQELEKLHEAILEESRIEIYSKPCNYLKSFNLLLESRVSLGFQEIPLHWELGDFLTTIYRYDKGIQQIELKIKQIICKKNASENGSSKHFKKKMADKLFNTDYRLINEALRSFSDDDAKEFFERMESAIEITEL